MNAIPRGILFAVFSMVAVSRASVHAREKRRERAVRARLGVGLTPDMSAPAVYARTMFPATIEVGKGNRVDGGTLLLPPASRRYELTGLAVGADGAPIADASVFLQDGRSRQASPVVRTSADGRFTLPAFGGHSYTVRAYVNVSANPFRQAQAAQSVTISGDPPPIRLILVVR